MLLLSDLRVNMYLHVFDRFYNWVEFNNTLYIINCIIPTRAWNISGCNFGSGELHFLLRSSLVKPHRWLKHTQYRYNLFSVKEVLLCVHVLWLSLYYGAYGLSIKSYSGNWKFWRHTTRRSFSPQDIDMKFANRPYLDRDGQTLNKGKTIINDLIIAIIFCTPSIFFMCLKHIPRVWKTCDEM